MGQFLPCWASEGGKSKTGVDGRRSTRVFGTLCWKIMALVIAYMRVCTWVAGFFSTHKRVGTDNVDQAPRISFYFLHQICQIMDLVLKIVKQINISRTTQICLKACPWNSKGEKGSVMMGQCSIPGGLGSECPVGAVEWWLQHSAPPTHENVVPMRCSNGSSPHSDTVHIKTQTRKHE